MGHSLTLLAAASGLVSVPARLVETRIAFSIVLMAALALAGREGGHRWRLAAAFGLVHGLGFATALQSLSLAREQLLPAVALFNVGVELGQVLIVLAVALPLAALGKLSRPVQRITLRFAAAGVALCGAWWMVERAVA